AQVYEGLINATKDIIFVPTPSEAEVARAEAAGVALEIYPVVREALTFFVYPGNPIRTLSTEQIEAIYTGELTAWPNNRSDIVAYQQPAGSIDQTLLMSLALGNAYPMTPPGNLRPTPWGVMLEVVAAYDNSPEALGFATFYNTQQLHLRDKVKLLAIDGVVPSSQTIADGSYPYQTNYAAVIRADEPADSLARQLVAWLLTWEGQQAISAAGYVPLDPEDIVPTRSDYGYFESTATNTTTSLGRGELSDQRAADADFCADGSCLSWPSLQPRATMAKYPLAETAVNTWIEDLGPPPTFTSNVTTCADDLCTLSPFESQVLWQVSTTRDLVVITRQITSTYPGAPTITTDSALFRLSDGYRMTLADLFYDGVNYIEFINKNLLNLATNQSLADCTLLGFANMIHCEVAETVALFTGIPDSYPLFTLSDGVIEFRLPAGNPFLVTTEPGSQPTQVIDSYVRLRLPADLSAYGTYWRSEGRLVGTTQVEFLHRNLVKPDPIDEILNGNILAFAQANPTALSITIASVNADIVTVQTNAGTKAHFSYTTGERLP
ncbi:MAG: substrate-binding domain-containing protein, partial [Propionibacteriaceae bacterium]|nr:substrate-binding domain-containing protein [Propionibacteriaceae bacterium]